MDGEKVKGMKKRYNITGIPTNIESWERDIRERWSEEAKAKNDRIIGNGYAERQIADTLSKVEPINVNVSKIGKNMDALIRRGDAVEALAVYYPEEERDKMREIFADILNDAPEVKQKRGSWIRDSEKQLSAPGLYRYFCSCCSSYHDARPNYCPNCGAYMRSKR